MQSDAMCVFEAMQNGMWNTEKRITVVWMLKNEKKNFSCRTWHLVCSHDHPLLPSGWEKNFWFYREKLRIGYTIVYKKNKWSEEVACNLFYSYVDNDKRCVVIEGAL